VPGRRQAVEQVQLADQRWNAALDASALAPPDEDFARRLREIADACEQEAAALQLAASTGIGWNPAPGSSSMKLSYELRPGGNRPGPSETWDTFDEAVRRLGVAMEGVAVSAVARGFGELSEITRTLADELDTSRRRRRTG
jgi:hypothetical protein